MESESSRSTACIPSLGQSTYGSVCTQVQPQTSNLHVSETEVWKVDSLVQSWEGRYVRVPTNGFDQTDSEQVNLAQSGADPLSLPLWPKQEWFPDLLRLSIAFPLVLLPTAKLLKQSFSQTFSSEASDSTPSRVEVICRSNQARGFSEQVSNRITVPQRKFTLDLYE